MPQPDPASITWARLVKEAVPEGPASHLEVVTCVERSGNVEVVFHGTGSFKNELFGVRIPIPRAIGDDDWRQTVGPNPDEPDSTATPEDWASLVTITDIMALYDMMNPADPPTPDSQGVRWLRQTH